MAQEDQTEKYSNSSGGIGGVARSSKRPKQKKVPQRGFGVAQLEKIRLEEQEKKDADVAAAAAILPSPTKSSYLPLSMPTFHHTIQHSPPIPLPSGSPPNFRLPLSLQNMETKVSSTVPLANRGGGDFETGWPAFPVPGHGNVPKLWSSHELDFEKESFGMDPELAFSSTLPYESNAIWFLPNLVQRTPQYQQPSSLMMSVSSGTSSTPVSHISIEPPSNQNYSSSCVPFRPEEKMVGIKRPYPFSLNVPPVPSFDFKLPTFAAPMKTNESIPCGSGSGFNFDGGNSTFSRICREVPSRSASNSEQIPKKSNSENENFNGNFLTLAPPTPTSCPPSKFKSPSTFLAFHNQEHPDFECLSCQAIEDQIPPPPGFSGFNQQQQSLYSFFLPAEKAAQIGQTAARIQNCNEVGEIVDLNLKL